MGSKLLELPWELWVSEEPLNIFWILCCYGFVLLALHLQLLGLPTGEILHFCHPAVLSNKSERDIDVQFSSTPGIATTPEQTKHSRTNPEMNVGQYPVYN